jgi:hypothetical protein
MVVEACSWQGGWLVDSRTHHCRWLGQGGSACPFTECELGWRFGAAWCSDQPGGRLYSVVVIDKEKSEGSRSNTCHPSVIAPMITSDGESHALEWSSICHLLWRP